MRPKVGMTLPSFVNDPAVPIRVARAAEAAGLDGVFVFDHLFRRARDGSRRPALEGPILLAAVAAATQRIDVGVLVLRATLRAPAALRATLDTLHRVAGDRFLPAIGSGDSESREENESFGLGFGTINDRIAAMRASVVEVRDRGFPVWVGGHVEPVRAAAAELADGWNRWGGTLDRFTRQADEVRTLAVRAPFTCSWGGLLAIDADEARATEKAARLSAPPDAVVGGPERVAGTLAGFAAAGADWVVLGPVDPRDPANASLLGEVRARLSA